MTDEERRQREEHWRALAEQLGLDPASEPSPEAEPRTLPRDEPASISPAVRAEEPEWDPAETQPRSEERAVDAEAEEETHHGTGQALDVDTPPARLERERPARSKRGRGRRAPRKESVAEDPEGTPEVMAEREEPPGADHESPVATQESGKRERRGRRRGRPRDHEPVAESDQPEADEPDATAHTEAEEDDTEEVDTLSDWNVPSWNELIASLYRPPDR